MSVKTHDDGINISAAGFDGNNTFDVDLFDMDSGIRSKTVSINGELDIVNKPYVSLALLGKIPLSSDLEVYGLEVMQDLYKNYNIDQTLGIDVQGRIPLPSKMRLNLSATYLVERNLHGAVKPKFLVRAGIGFILGELW